MKATVIAAILVCLFAIFIAFGAEASCNSRQAIVDWLETAYSEVPVAVALAANGSVMEVYASPEGTWTIAVTDASGETCLLASGEGWELLPPKLPGVQM